ncbi:EpsG family protein [Bacillus licheniformis]|nr:EpsG family protein [Bacillus licheniformis]
MYAALRISRKYNSIWEIFGFGTGKSSTDPGFTALLWILNQISADPALMFAVVAAITYIYIVKTLYVYGRPFELSMFLFIGMFHYYASFNGIRQYMAAAILFGRCGI